MGPGPGEDRGRPARPARATGGVRVRPLRAALGLVLALLVTAGCGSCPPAWAEASEVLDGYRYAAASAGEVAVLADATDLALTRAARRLAAALGLDVERRLAVALRDGRLFVEAWGPDGPLNDLEGLELVALERCAGRTHARVRLELR